MRACIQVGPPMICDGNVANVCGVVSDLSMGLGEAGGRGQQALAALSGESDHEVGLLQLRPPVRRRWPAAIGAWSSAASPEGSESWRAKERRQRPASPPTGRFQDTTRTIGAQALVCLPSNISGAGRGVNAVPACERLHTGADGHRRPLFLDQFCYPAAFQPFSDVKVASAVDRHAVGAVESTGLVLLPRVVGPAFRL